MKKAIPFRRELDWEQRVGFDPMVDYISILNDYNHFVEVKDKEAISKILNEQDGLIQLCAKASYQKGMKTGIEYVQDYERIR